MIEIESGEKGVLYLRIAQRGGNIRGLMRCVGTVF
jgi:hypothetical protein